MKWVDKETREAIKNGTLDEQKAREKEERIRRNMKLHGLDAISGEENQMALEHSISLMCHLYDCRAEKRSLTPADVDGIKMEQLDVLIDQNFVIIRQLDKILKRLEE